MRLTAHWAFHKKELVILGQVNWYHWTWYTEWKKENLRGLLIHRVCSLSFKGRSERKWAKIYLRKCMPWHFYGKFDQKEQSIEVTMPWHFKVGIVCAFLCILWAERLTYFYQGYLFSGTSLEREAITFTGARNTPPTTSAPYTHFYYSKDNIFLVADNRQVNYPFWRLSFPKVVIYLLQWKFLCV
jgi:hypothetical protein